MGAVHDHGEVPNIGYALLHPGENNRRIEVKTRLDGEFLCCTGISSTYLKCKCSMARVVTKGFWG